MNFRVHFLLPSQNDSTLVLTAFSFVFILLDIKEVAHSARSFSQDKTFIPFSSRFRIAFGISIGSWFWGATKIVQSL